MLRPPVVGFASCSNSLAISSDITGSHRADCGLPAGWLTRIFPHIALHSSRRRLGIVEAAGFPHPIGAQPGSLLALSVEVLASGLVKVTGTMTRKPCLSAIRRKRLVNRRGVLEKVGLAHVIGPMPCPFSPAAALIMSARFGMLPASLPVPFPFVCCGFWPNPSNPAS